MISIPPPPLSASPPSGNGPSACDRQSAETVLDRLPRLASGLLRVPVALVVLVEDGQPRLTRSVGLANEGERELPADPFWARMLDAGESAVLEDAREKDGPLGGGLELAAWLGAPLSTPSGDVRGCLCVAAPDPRAWSREEAALLQNLAAVAGAGMDPTVRPEERRSEEAAILDSIPHACFALDRQWRFTYLSLQAQQLFGQMSRRSGLELLGCNILEECPEVADSTFVRAGQQALAEQRHLEVETYYPALRGWFAVHLSAMSGGGVAVFLQNVNERAGLARALGKTTEELAEADRGKEEFLVQLAYEVRGALGPIRNALHLTRTHAVEDPEDEQACALAAQEVRWLSRLMDDLVNVSELLPGNVQMQKKQVNLSALLAHAATNLLSSSAAGGRSLTISLPAAPVWIDAGQEQLAQVLQHLLDNAARFTHPGGHIRLTLEREAGAAVLRVCDDGVGMSADLLPRIFNLFMRPDHGNAAFSGGVGIGLTLVRRLVALHGGTVEARSEGPGCGSEFLVRLPAPEGLPAVPDPGAGEEKALQVLVVDDSMENAQSLGLILSRWGYEAHVVYDGPHAVAKAAACHPDVVLLDIAMPGMNGYQVAEQLRQQAGPEKMVLASVSGYSEDEVRRSPSGDAFDYHLVKPLNPEELKDLLTAVECVVRQRRSRSAG